MGIFGIGEEKTGTDLPTSNEDIVKEVVSEVASSVPVLETNPQSPVEQKDMIINPEEKKLIETFRGVKDPSRREFLKELLLLAASVTVGAAATACTPRQPFRDEELENSVESMRPESTKTPEIKNEILYVKDLIRLNPRDFSTGVEGYPDAIVGRSMFATKENGEPLFLKYPEDGREVTYLHYTGEKPPVVGEILPLMYKVPEDIGNREIIVTPYAISVQSERAKIDLNNGKNHYLVPIVTSGYSTGIVQIFKDGEKINTSYKPFEVKPDSVTRITNGYLSWAILSEVGNELIVEGVIANNGYMDGIMISPDSIPQEVSDLTPQY